MHPTAYKNGEKFAKKYLSEKDTLQILDVGSFDVNGSLKPIFTKPNWKYVGMDREGSIENNVDVHLADPFHFPFSDNTFDVIVSTSCLEHDPAFWVTFQEMVRISKNGGWIYLNTPSDGPYHGYPIDCWRFLKDAYQALADWCKIELVKQYIDTGDMWKDNVGIFKVTK